MFLHFAANHHKGWLAASLRNISQIWVDASLSDASRKKNAACGVVTSRLKQKISTSNKVGARHKSIVNQEDILGAVGPKRTAGQGAFDYFRIPATTLMRGSYVTAGLDISTIGEPESPAYDLAYSGVSIVIILVSKRYGRRNWNESNTLAHLGYPHTTVVCRDQFEKTHELSGVFLNGLVLVVFAIWIRANIGRLDLVVVDQLVCMRIIKAHARRVNMKVDALVVFGEVGRSAYRIDHSPACCVAHALGRLNHRHDFGNVFSNKCSTLHESSRPRRVFDDARQEHQRLMLIHAGTSLRSCAAGLPRLDNDGRLGESGHGDVSLGEVVLCRAVRLVIVAIYRDLAYEQMACGNLVLQRPVFSWIVAVNRRANDTYNVSVTLYGLGHGYGVDASGESGNHSHPLLAEGSCDSTRGERTSLAWIPCPYDGYARRFNQRDIALIIKDGERVLLCSEACWKLRGALHEDREPAEPSVNIVLHFIVCVNVGYHAIGLAHGHGWKTSICIKNLGNLAARGPLHRIQVFICHQFVIWGNDCVLNRLGNHHAPSPSFTNAASFSACLLVGWIESLSRSLWSSYPLSSFATPSSVEESRYCPAPAISALTQSLCSSLLAAPLPLIDRFLPLISHDIINPRVRQQTAIRPISPEKKGESNLTTYRGFGIFIHVRRASAERRWLN